MSRQEFKLSLISQILQIVDENTLQLLQKSLSKSQKTPKKTKTTWENCDSPIREMSLEEAKVIAEFEANPELLGVEESAKFLEELKVFTNLKSNNKSNNKFQIGFK
jgi:sucrose-6-phosphate hydrolase SacC (GH32 family)